MAGMMMDDGSMDMPGPMRPVRPMRAMSPAMRAGRMKAATKVAARRGATPLMDEDRNMGGVNDAFSALSRPMSARRTTGRRSRGRY